MRDIFAQINKKVEEEFLPELPKKLHKRFLTGIQIFSLQEFISINANGRSSCIVRSTGEMRSYRCVHEERFIRTLPKLACKFVNNDTKEIQMSLDFSKVGKLQIAALNVTTSKGRALPIYVETYLAIPKKNTMIPKLIKALKEFLENIENPERLVIAMDRWFASPKLLRYLNNEAKVKFVCRIRSNISIEVPWDKEIRISEISNEDSECIHANLKLRLVQSNWNELMKDPEPWFLLTNINKGEKSRKQIINIYANRFEIEEYFKDLKWILRYEWNMVKTPEVLSILIWFVILGWWLLKEIFWNEILKSRAKRINPKKKLSIFRVAWEALKKSLWPYNLRFIPL